MELNPKIGDVWYRYDDYKTASIDADFDRVYVSRPQLRESTYVVDKVTPKGVWVRHFWDDPVKGLRGDRHFVLQGEGKRKAHPTKELALKSFLARKERQAEIYSARLADAEHAKLVAKYELNRLAPPPETAPNPSEFLDLLV